MLRFYDRSGQEITLEQFGAYLADRDYRVVAHDHVETAANHILVSTVWLGLDQALGTGGPPLIFETMVFHMPGMKPVAGIQERYSTEVQALSAHDQILAAVREQIL